MVNRAIKYSIYPYCHDAAVLVVIATSLKAAIQAAFNCELVKIHSIDLEVRTELFENDVKERQAFYGIVGALGLTDDKRAVICSCHVITYNSTPEREQADLNELATFKPKTFAA